MKMFCVTCNSYTCKFAEPGQATTHELVDAPDRNPAPVCADPRCYLCYPNAYRVREAVDGDIYPTAPHLYWSRAAVYEDYPRGGFGEWAKSIRTKKLMERCTNVEKHCDSQSHDIDELKRALRQEKSLREVYQRICGRRRERIAELERQLERLENSEKVNGDYISLMSKRLSNARRHLARVRKAVDVYEPDDSGPGLDP